MTLSRQELADAVRPFGPRGKLQPEHIPALDALADALGLPRDDTGGDRLGSLSAEFESGGRGPGTVSGGQGDPGGVSYGTYQLASKTGTAAAFVAAEGAAWQQLRAAAPGTPAFSSVWKDIAAREPEAFDAAQHAFIERTHYRPVVERVKAKTGVDLDLRTQAVRDATWSAAVQHGGAVDILADAIGKVGPSARDDALLRAIYARRSDYVRAIAGRNTGAERKTLLSIVDNRYPAELAKALAMIGGKA